MLAHMFLGDLRVKSTRQLFGVGVVMMDTSSQNQQSNHLLDIPGSLKLTIVDLLIPGVRYPRNTFCLLGKAGSTAIVSGAADADFSITYFACGGCRLSVRGPGSPHSRKTCYASFAVQNTVLSVSRKVINCKFLS